MVPRFASSIVLALVAWPAVAIAQPPMQLDATDALPCFEGEPPYWSPSTRIGSPVAGSTLYACDGGWYQPVFDLADGEQLLTSRDDPRTGALVLVVALPEWRGTRIVRLGLVGAPDGADCTTNRRMNPGSFDVSFSPRGAIVLTWGAGTGSGAIEVCMPDGTSWGSGGTAVDVSPNAAFFTTYDGTPVDRVGQCSYAPMSAIAERALPS